MTILELNSRRRYLLGTGREVGKNRVTSRHVHKAKKDERVLCFGERASSTQSCTGSLKKYRKGDEIGDIDRSGRRLKTCSGSQNLASSREGTQVFASVYRDLSALKNELLYKYDSWPSAIIRRCLKN